MATVVNNRSSLLTDPLRNFRFLVTIKPHKVGTAGTGANATTTLTYADNINLGFTSVSGLAVTTDSIPYREGGYNTTVHQIPGQTTFSPVTLQRGVILNTTQNWEWMKELFYTLNGNSNGTAITNDFRADIEIRVLSHPVSVADKDDTNADGHDPNNTTTGSGSHVAMRFNVYNAWITSLAYSDLAAGDNAILVEQMTLVHEGFDLHWAEKLTTSAAPF